MLSRGLSKSQLHFLWPAEGSIRCSAEARGESAPSSGEVCNCLSINRLRRGRWLTPVPGRSSQARSVRLRCRHGRAILGRAMQRPRTKAIGVGTDRRPRVPVPGAGAHLRPVTSLALLTLVGALLSGCGKSQSEFLVNDESGSPVAGVQVSYEKDVDSGEEREIAGQTNSQGNLILSGKHLGMPRQYYFDKQCTLAQTGERFDAANCRIPQAGIHNL